MSTKCAEGLHARSCAVRDVTRNRGMGVVAREVPQRVSGKTGTEVALISEFANGPREMGSVGRRHAKSARRTFSRDQVEPDAARVSVNVRSDQTSRLSNPRLASP